jgi:prenyl protein peptidase
MLPPRSLLFPLLYVLPFYVRPTGLPRNHSRTIWSRMILTTLAVALLSWVPTYRALESAQSTAVSAAALHPGLSGVPAPRNIHLTSTDTRTAQRPGGVSLLAAIGLRRPGLLAACTLPVLLTAVLFLGPLVMDSLEGGLLSYRRPPSAAIGIRNLLAAPLTEELCFRGGLVSFLLLSGTSPARCIWTSPLLFGVAHLHHAYDLVRHQRWSLAQALAAAAFQLVYTAVFGWFAAFLLLRTGHLAAPVAVHAFCNFMGLPRFCSVLASRRKRLVAGAYACGIVGFGWLLLPLTDPQRYGYAAGSSYALELAALSRPRS